MMYSLPIFLLMTMMPGAVHCRFRHAVHDLNGDDEQHGRRALEATNATIGGVSFAESTYRLYFLSSTDELNYGAVGVPSGQYEDVPSYVLENNVGVRVTAVARSATVTEISVDGTNYLWENIEGGTYYGAQTSNFPLQRGLIVHGGIRYTAVTAEHGLFYDIDWNVEVDDSDQDSMTIYMSIVDDAETRDRAANFIPPMGTTTPNLSGFSTGQFDSVVARGPTNLKYTLAITLRRDEDFVRLNMSVENFNTTAPQYAEAWLPMTFPITNASVILSKQTMRWRRDNWCLNDVTPNMVMLDEYDFLHRPLDWPMGCVFYDIPQLEGKYHGVTTDEGRGVVYYLPGTSPHYTKQWSWGQPEWGRGSSGRPVSDYYEPWSSGTNFAFFQTTAFEPQTRVEWDVVILPIQQGLDPTTLSRDELLDAVDRHIDDRMDQLLDGQDSEIIGTDGENSTTVDEENNADVNSTTVDAENNADVNSTTSVEENKAGVDSLLSDATTAFGRQEIVYALSLLLLCLL
jgi:hypothetical protein